MKRILLLAGILTTFNIFAQINVFEEEHLHHAHCKHYSEETAIEKFAYRNDWQSPLVHHYDVSFYFLNIEISHTSVAVGGTTEIHGKVVAPLLDTFAFELITQHAISNIVFNGVSYSQFTRVGDNVLVPVNPLLMGETFVASITYSGMPPTGGFFAGVTNATSSLWQKNVTWSLSEPFAAKDWFPCKQELTDKADSVWVFLTAPQGTMAASQGLLTSVVPLPDNRNRFEWKSKYPIAYYLISFAVADYQEYNIYAMPQEMNGDSLLVQNFVYNHPNYLPQNQNKIDATVPMIELFSDLYTLYPFYEEKYGHALTQLGGGMEHQTISTMGNFEFNLIAHELGHMWFGDNVTCATWSDIWINEGFATYSNYLAQAMLNGWNAGQNFMINTQNNVMTQNGGSVYIPPSEISPDNISRIFSGRLSYNKGASIIHVLRHEINNDDVFFNILQSFQNQFADSTATGEDFKMVAEAVSGVSLEQFFNQWYYGEGYPKYDIEWYMQNNDLIMNVLQTTSSSTSLFDMTMSYRINFADNSSEIIRLHQNLNFKQFVIPVNKQVVSIQVDPENWTFEKVNSIVVGFPDFANPAYFTFGPNPASDQIAVYCPQVRQQALWLELNDLSGKILIQKQIEFENEILDISSLSPGAYLLKISDGQQQWNRKLVKN